MKNKLILKKLMYYSAFQKAIFHDVIMSDFLESFEIRTSGFLGPWAFLRAYSDTKANVS